ncbi:MAG: sugar phosphate isomerase/epimerase [Acidobacteria bacterium]|nr:sugar phosphate isomerase/epimerase [Acidobacteriota bacterium]
MSSQRIQRRDFLKQASAVAGATAAFGLGGARMLSASPQGGRQPGQRTGGAAKRQFSLAHLTVLGCAPPEMTYIAARAGYDFVSYRLIYMGLAGEPNYDLANNKDMLRQTKTALASTGLKLQDIEVARISDGLDPKKYLPAMETAAELGGKYVLANNWTTDRNFAVDCFAQLCDLAKPLGLTVECEFVPFAAGGKNLADAVALLRDARRTNCGVLVDTLHFSRSRVTLAELDAVPRDWFHFAHVCDAPAEIPTTNEGLIHTAREERLYPGEGAIDIAAILNRMPQVPYSLEIPHLARVKELGYAEHAFRCLQTARTYLEAHPRAQG